MPGPGPDTGTQAQCYALWRNDSGAGVEFEKKVQSTECSLCLFILLQETTIANASKSAVFFVFFRGGLKPKIHNLPEQPSFCINTVHQQIYPRSHEPNVLSYCFRVVGCTPTSAPTATSVVGIGRTMVFSSAAAPAPCATNGSTGSQVCQVRAFLCFHALLLWTTDCICLNHEICTKLTLHCAASCAWSVRLLSKGTREHLRKLDFQRNLLRF